MDVGVGCPNNPTGARFEFRSTGDEPLRLVVATIPPRPGDDEGDEVRRSLGMGSMR